MPLQINDAAPAFVLAEDENKNLSLADFKGKNIVIYFYPKDNTSGCTREAEDFAANYNKFKKLNTEIIGISKDSIKSHKNFKAKYKLPFILLSDAETIVCKAYGVWVKKKMYGREYLGTERSTFLIDSQGVIRQMWRNVKVPGHVEEVLATVKDLQ